MSSENLSRNTKSLPIGLDIVRILLGIGLMARGVIYLSDSNVLTDAITETFGINNPAYATVICAMHLVTGFLIMCGFATRIACFIQAGILLACFAFLYNQFNIIPVMELFYAGFLLLGVIFFLVKGAGRLSLHYFLFI